MHFKLKFEDFAGSTALVDRDVYIRRPKTRKLLLSIPRKRSEPSLPTYKDYFVNTEININGNLLTSMKTMYIIFIQQDEIKILDERASVMSSYRELCFSWLLKYVWIYETVPKN